MLSIIVIFMCQLFIFYSTRRLLVDLHHWNTIFAMLESCRSMCFIFNSIKKQWTFRFRIGWISKFNEFDSRSRNGISTVSSFLMHFGRGCLQNRSFWFGFFIYPYKLFGHFPKIISVYFHSVFTHRRGSCLIHTMAWKHIEQTLTDS